jgi:hypothetical protein
VTIHQWRNHPHEIVVGLRGKGPEGVATARRNFEVARRRARKAAVAMAREYRNVLVFVACGWLLTATTSISDNFSTSGNLTGDITR